MSNLKENIKAAQIDLIKELGIDKLEPAQKEKILTQIGEIIQQRVMRRIVEELPEEKQDEFNVILEKAQENPDQLDKFLEENIPEVENLVLAEIGEYKKGATDFMNQALGQTNVSEPEKTEEVEETKEEVLSKVSEPEVVSEPIQEDKEDKEQEKIEEVKEPEVAPESIQTDTTKEIGEVIEESEDPKEVVVPEASEEVVEKTETVEPEIKTEINEGAEEVKKVEEKAEFKVGPEPIKPVELNQFAEKTEEKEDEPPVVKSGIEQEQIDQEAQILEENKIENAQVAGEELDLSNEIGKMTSTTDEEIKQ